MWRWGIIFCFVLFLFLCIPNLIEALSLRIFSPPCLFRWKEKKKKRTRNLTLLLRDLKKKIVVRYLYQNEKYIKKRVRNNKEAFLPLPFFSFSPFLPSWPVYALKKQPKKPPKHIIKREADFYHCKSTVNFLERKKVIIIITITQYPHK